MKNSAKQRMIATIIVLFVAVGGIFAQSNYPTPTGTYITLPEVAGEATDTVVVGARMPYYVAPDATIDAAITSGFMNNSVFKWVFPASAGSVLKYDGTATTPAAGYYSENEVSVVWSALGSFSVQNTEKSVPKVGTGCDGTTVSRTVVVQALPTFAFPAANTTGTCFGGTTTFNLPIALSGSGPWKISYTVSDGTNTLTVTDQVVTNGKMPYTASIATLLLPVNLASAPLTGAAATYTVTVTKVIDRITEKALNALAGVVDPSNDKFKIGIIAAPVTQPIQHIKNL